ncbi:MAG TPA: HupE/UreJ family protein [Candidatus Latescibacteria bacterium]|nr:HupE/UreJ family protein [Candidatus Latescibacterota bacterium]HJN27797.1 HupE/UreJ family protein [Candidatus Latescibacterota bacterium]
MAAILLIHARPGAAHEINTSYSVVSVRSDSVRLILSIDEADLIRLDPQIDVNGDGLLYRDEVRGGGEAMALKLQDRLSTEVDGEPHTPEMLSAAPEVDVDGNLFLRIVYDVPLADEPPATLVLDLEKFLQAPLLDEHKNLVRVFVASDQPELLAVLSASSPVGRFQLREEVDLLAQVMHFVWLGVEHIFIGYDHIMFLAALIVIGSRLGPLVKIVSAFTVAHSITLILAALEIVSLPTRWVEAGIALSIAYVALENFWIRGASHRWMLTFAFGFVHGFGFANVLRDLGLPSQGLVPSLLAFNVGVEIGQVVIVAILLPGILWAAKHGHQQRLVQVASAVILLFGVGWFVERVFDLSYMPI